MYLFRLLRRGSALRLRLDGDNAAARTAQQLERQHISHLRSTPPCTDSRAA